MSKSNRSTARHSGSGRHIKRQFPRTEILQIRISKEHKQLLSDIMAQFDEEIPSNVISQADIVEWGIELYAAKNHVIPKWNSW